MCYSSRFCGLTGKFYALTRAHCSQLATLLGCWASLFMWPFNVSFSTTVSGFRESKTHCISVYQISAWITCIDVLMAKARHMAKSRVQEGEDETGQDLWEVWWIGNHYLTIYHKSLSIWWKWERTLWLQECYEDILQYYCLENPVDGGAW